MSNLKNPGQFTISTRMVVYRILLRCRMQSTCVTVF